LHEISNDNGVRSVNFATSKNLRNKSTKFPHRNIHKYTWTSPDGKTHNQIDHTLVDGRRHLNVLDVRSFRAADCDIDHYLEVAIVRSAALEDSDAEVEINSAWVTMRENIKISAKDSLGYFELKKHKPWFDKGSSQLLH
jgi:hypothetical protein